MKYVNPLILAIKDLRLEANLTQREFAELVGLTSSAISMWENGDNNNPNYSTIERALKALNFNIQYRLVPTGRKLKHTVIIDNTPGRNNGEALFLLLQEAGVAPIIYWHDLPREAQQNYEKIAEKFLGS